MMINQVFLELHSKNMDAGVYTTFTPINFNVALLQDIQLNLSFEAQGWVPNLYPDLNHSPSNFFFEAAFKIQI